MPLVKYNHLFSGTLKTPAYKLSSSSKTLEFQRSKLLIKQVDVKSLLLLLISDDNSILEQTLLYLNQVYDEEGRKQDRKLMANPDVVQKLLKILARPDSTACIQKLTLKLLIELVKTEGGLLKFCDDIPSLDIFLTISHNAAEPVILEMCLYILSILTVNQEHCKFLKCSLGFFKNQVETSHDMDIQYNCMKILENILLCDMNMPHTYWDMPVETIFNLFVESRVERVQDTCLNLLYLLRHLTHKEIPPAEEFIKLFGGSPGEELMKLFGGFNKALDMVKKRPNKTQKIILINLIGTFPFNFIDLTAVKNILGLLQTYEDSPDIIKALLDILVHLCSEDNCAYLVKSMHLGSILTKYLVSNNGQVSHTACEGVIILCEKYDDYLCENAKNPAILDHIFQTLKEEDDVEYKAWAGRLLLLLIGHISCCDYIINSINAKSIPLKSKLHINSQTGNDKIQVLLDVSLKSSNDDLTKILLCSLYKLTSTCQCFGKKHLDMILAYIKDGKDQNKIKIDTLIEIMNVCLGKSGFVKTFIDSAGLPAIDSHMKLQSDTKLLITYGNFLMNACKYPVLTKIINELNTFKWMNKHNLWQEPLWNRIIATLLDINLPMKFAYTNALSFMDITSDGFYVFKDLKHVNLYDFPSLNEILEENDQSKVVFLFTLRKVGDYYDDFIDKYISDVTTLLRHANNIHLKDISESLLSIHEESGQIDQLKQNLKADLEIIATYVVNQMIGHGDEIDKLGHEKHLEEIIEAELSSVIPIGHVKMGLQLERSFLFKVMCDVFGYPCTLVRNEFGAEVYNDVCVYSDEDIDEVNTDVSSNEKHRVSYYRVDLMTNPAQLIPLNQIDEII